MSATATLNLEPETLNSVTPSPPPPVSPSQKLPPTERDFEIYDAIHIACSSTRCQAELHQISQTRVRQIVRRVVEWLGEVLPPQTKVAKEQETHLARQIAADRFQRQLEQATTFWDMTQEVKYAGIRIRLTTAQARLGVVGGLIDGLVADAIEGLPVPAWQAPADPAAQPSLIVTDAESLTNPNQKSEIENLKSLFPPRGYTPKLRRGRVVCDEMPVELKDPILWADITPEIVAARAAWGRPFSPKFIKTLQDVGQLPRDDALSPTPARCPLPPASTPRSELRAPHSAPPPLGDCSPADKKSPDLTSSAPGSLTVNNNPPATCNNETPDQNNPSPREKTPSQPLLTTRDPLPVTVLQLTRNQPPQLSPEPRPPTPDPSPHNSPSLPTTI